MMLLGFLFSAAALLFLPCAVFTVDGVLRRLRQIFVQPSGPVIVPNKVVLVTGATSGIGQVKIFKEIHTFIFLCKCILTSSEIRNSVDAQLC